MINDEIKPLLQKENDSECCKKVGEHIANTTVIGAALGGTATAVGPAAVGLVIDATLGACLSDKEGENFCAFGLGIAGSLPGAATCGALGFLSGVATIPIVSFWGAPARCTEVRENIVDMVLNRSEPAASSQEVPQGLSMQK